MPLPDLSNQQDPLPLLRDRQVIDVSTTDYEREQGFICEVASTGSAQTIVVTTLEGTENTISGVPKNYIPSVASVPVALKKVEAAGNGDGTVTSIVVGLL